MRDVLRLLRPHQHIKNGFVLVGPLFGGVWDLELAVRTVIAFVAFSAAASAVYVVNDLLDVEADRAHPVKCRRPIASGAVSADAARGLAYGLAAAALVLAGLVGPWAVALIGAYAALNLGYSAAWKHVPVVDVFVIAAGFMLRLLTGTVGLGIPPSSWLLLCGLMLTLYLGFAKRRAELIEAAVRPDEAPAPTRRVLDAYTPALIEQFTSIAAACTILGYSLYTVAPETVARHHTPWLIATVPFVVYGIFRHLYLLHREGGGGDTARDLVADRHLLITAGLWLAVTIGLLA